MGKYKAFDKRSTKKASKATFHLKSIEMNCKNSAIVGRNGCIALHYYVHFLRIFSFVTRGIESEGVGTRSVRCLTPFT